MVVNLFFYFFHLVFANGYVEKEVFISVPIEINDVEAFWSSVIHQTTTTIFILADCNQKNGLELPNENNDVKFDCFSIKKNEKGKYSNAEDSLTVKVTGRKVSYLKLSPKL